MHQELATLKHYLKVVPFQYAFLDGETQHTYLYKANYNEYKPRKLEWYEGAADAYVDTDLVPNAVFHYDISPVRRPPPPSAAAVHARAREQTTRLLPAPHMRGRRVVLTARCSPDVWRR
jgi:hypothetical protein